MLDGLFWPFSRVIFVLTLWYSSYHYDQCLCNSLCTCTYWMYSIKSANIMFTLASIYYLKFIWCTVWVFFFWCLWMEWVIKQGSHRSLKTWKVLEFENLDFCRGLESPGIWTCRSIFLIISIHEFSHYPSSKIWVYFLHVKSSWIHWKGPWVWHWEILESPGIWDLKCVWTLLSLWLMIKYLVFV